VRFVETSLSGAFVLEPQKLEDSRGFFARCFSAREFEEHGMDPRVAQTNVSYNKRRGTLRGLHRQLDPHAESKLVRCTAGAIYDVIVDMRRPSPTYRRWFGIHLTAGDHKQLYVPAHFAHGFITLEDDTEVTYQISQYYTPQAEWGARYDDPAFAIDWPIPAVVLSDKDRSWPPFREAP
jgi:dTDP-4-dehydrorhamnose 3,5-epimerase